MTEEYWLFLVTLKYYTKTNNIVDVTVRVYQGSTIFFIIIYNDFAKMP